MTYLFLAGAVLTEVVATLALAASQSFSRLVPTTISVVCFVAAFWLLSFPLRTMPTGIVYAVWSGLTIVLVTAAAWIWAKQVIGPAAMVGMTLITVGVIIINMSSESEVSATVQEKSTNERRLQTDTSPISEQAICSAAKSTATQCYLGAPSEPLVPRGPTSSFNSPEFATGQLSNAELRTIETIVATATSDEHTVMRLESVAALTKLHNRLSQRPLLPEEEKVAKRAIELLVCIEAADNVKDRQFRVERRAQLSESYLGTRSRRPLQIPS